MRISLLGIILFQIASNFESVVFKFLPWISVPLRRHINSFYKENPIISSKILSLIKWLTPQFGFYFSLPQASLKWVCCQAIILFSSENSESPRHTEQVLLCSQCFPMPVVWTKRMCSTVSLHLKWLQKNLKNQKLKSRVLRPKKHKLLFSPITVGP